MVLFSNKDLSSQENLIEISREQHEILLGTILGDCHVELAPNGMSARIKIAQSLEHKFYVNHLWKQFNNWGLSEINTRERKDKSVICEFNSKFTPSLLPYQKLFYGQDKKKKIPSFINNEFTARSFSYLYMDDGGLKSKDSKGVFINTYNDFSVDDQKMFCDYLTLNFGLKATISIDRKAPRIFISGKCFEILTLILNQRILPDFSNKVPTPRKKGGNWRAIAIPQKIIEKHAFKQDDLSAKEVLNVKDIRLFNLLPVVEEP